MITNEICRQPFLSDCWITVEGDVTLCCWIDKFIGNVKEMPFEEIWNSPEAQAIRGSILNGKYTYCNRKVCSCWLVERTSEENEIMPYPKMISFRSDHECNLACFTCRDTPIHYSQEKLNELNERIDSIYLPMLKGISRVFMNGNGEVFVSRHSRLLVQRIAQTYPDMRFIFITNGTLCNRRALQDLGVANRVDEIQVSIHAVTKEMWMKFTRGSAKQYDMLIKNLNELAEMKRTGELSGLCFHFVLTAVNYTELADFIRFANKFSARVSVPVYKNWCLQTDKEAKKLTICDPKHKDYEKLKEILKDPVFDLPQVYLFPTLRKIRQDAINNI